MAGAATVRLFARSTSAAVRFSSGAKTFPFRLSATKPPSHRIFRRPVELIVCLEPFYAITSSALIITSMLTLSRNTYDIVWLPEGS